eukprot:Sdes_comp20481_c0_seq1m14815
MFPIPFHFGMIFPRFPKPFYVLVGSSISIPQNHIHSNICVKGDANFAESRLNIHVAIILSLLSIALTYTLLHFFFMNAWPVFQGADMTPIHALHSFSIQINSRFH